MDTDSSIVAAATSDIAQITTVAEEPTTTSDIPTTTTTTSAPVLTTTTVAISEPPIETPTNEPEPTTTLSSTSKKATTAASSTKVKVSTSTKKTSSAVDVVTTFTSGSVVITSTSTSFSEYYTSIPTVVEDKETSTKSSSIGAIAGGIVGGVAAILLIAFLFWFIKRRKNKESKEVDFGTGSDYGAPSALPPHNSHPFDYDYNAYGAPGVGTDSVPSSRPISTNMNLQTGNAIKPRPFVQAYDPTLEDQNTHYSSHDGSVGNQYSDYSQPYSNQGYNAPVGNANPQGQYYINQYDPMLYNNQNPVDYNRNVPNENDYYTPIARRESRHVPNEKSS